MRTLVLLIFILSHISVLAQPEPKDTEDWSRKPVKVIPVKGAKPPSDAIVLYRGENYLSEWEHLDGDKVKWKSIGKSLRIESKTGDIQTKQKFGDIQLHIEWKTPAPKEDEGQNMGNSGILIMGLYELQIYESYYNEIYYNGQAGSIYKQHTPLVNACLKPKKWQSFDVVFTAPKFNNDKSLKEPAHITVFQNGIMILNHVEIKGPMVYVGYPKYEYHGEKLPLRLQEHGSRVSYRNIWVREL